MNCIYKLISPSGKCYIGKTNNIICRMGAHYYSSYNKNCKEYNFILHKSIRKYNFYNFKCEILNENLSQEQANMWERLWIFAEKSNNRKFGYNMTEGRRESANKQQAFFSN